MFALLCILGPNVLGAFGIAPLNFYAGVMAMCIPLTFINFRTYNKDVSFVWMFVFCELYGVFRMFWDQGEGARYTSIVIMSTPLFLAAFPRDIKHIYGKDRYTPMWHTILRTFFVFFIIETVIASFEGVAGFNLFGMQVNDIDNVSFRDASEGFRSTSLHSHPLCNALIVSTSMAFIITSKLQLKRKMLLWFLGYFAILGFNTRGSIVGNAVFLLIYVLHSIRSKGIYTKKQKELLIRLFFLSIIVGLFLFFKLGLGSRLMSMGLYDEGSASVRVDTWQIFNHFSLLDFLWGGNMVQIKNVLYTSGIDVTENFLIDYLLSCGLVFLIFYLFFYVNFIRRLYRGYDKFTKFYTSAVFLLIASTNNSLSTMSIALFLYHILIILFNPKFFNDYLVWKNK